MIDTSCPVAPGMVPDDASTCHGERSCEPRLIVLEGLSAVGKSTIAPLLAQRLGAQQLDTLIPHLEPARRYIDEQRSVVARLHFWMAANYLISDVIRETLRTGRDVVIESYFFRTLATHAAMGARHLPTIDWDEAATPDLAIELTLDEHLRQRRLAARMHVRPAGYWSAVEERNVAVTRQLYDSFGPTQLDTSGLSPHEVVDRIERLIRTNAAPHA